MSSKNLSRPSQYTRKKIQNFSYGLTDQIGKGYSSQVYRGRNDDTDLQVAVKVIDMKMLKSQINKQLLSSEIQILKRMKNYPHILKLHEVYTTKNNTYIITELCQGDLSKKIKNKLTQHQAVKFMKQLLVGYSHIFKQSIVHRDLKPANLLLTSQNLLKIADFGFAVDAEEVVKPSKYNVGSPLYMAPQSLKKNEYSFKTDVWSIGVIFYEMLTSETPWRAKNQKQLVKKIEQQKIETILLNKDFTPAVKQFITRSLTIDKHQRISPQQLIKFCLGFDQPHPVILTQKKLNLTFKYDTLGSQSGTPHKSAEKKKLFHFADNSISLNNIASFNHKSDKQIVKGFKNSEECLNGRNLIENMQVVQQIKKQGENIKLKEGLKKEQKKNISKILIAEVHFCRFLFKLLMRIKQSVNSGIFHQDPHGIQIKRIFQTYTKLIKNKLHQIIHFEVQNFLSIQQQSYQLYKETSDFKKLVKISKEYLDRYSKQLVQFWVESPINILDWKVLYDPTTTNQLIYYLKNKLETIISESTYKTKNAHTRKHSSKENQQINDIISNCSKDIIILDYLMTSRQLLDILRQNPSDHERFARKSRIQQIVEGATANIDYQLYSKIIQRATLLLQSQHKKIQNRCR